MDDILTEGIEPEIIVCRLLHRNRFLSLNVEEIIPC